MMGGDRRGTPLSTESALEVIGAIEDPMRHIDRNDCYVYGEDIAEVAATKKAEELIGCLERGELIVPAKLHERMAAAILRFRLGGS
ncbi:MAG: hypothetical protein ABSD38_35735 [Syntrophorhabdales bacterium]|jgi:hypothetical protein